MSFLARQDTIKMSNSQSQSWVLIMQLLPASAALAGSFVEGLTGFGSAVVVLLAAQIVLMSAQLGWLDAENLPPAILDYDYWTAVITVCQVLNSKFSVLPSIALKF